MLKAPKGTKDVLPNDAGAWHFVERKARDVAQICGCHEIRTPVLEHTELFARGVGDGTDIVEKEMYTFEDRAGRSLTLRPEGTAGVARAFIQSGLAAGPLPVRLYYLSPAFRYERPQSGRLREHHQFGVEIFGATDAVADAETMWMAMEVMLRVGLPSPELVINSIGCDNCRPAYVRSLKDYLTEHADGLCSTCKSRIERNTLRVLDCKTESCQDIIAGAPRISDFLCDECSVHMSSLEMYLSALGLEYVVNPRLVRGLDYYTRTVFEIVVRTGGAQGTVCGGGRYNNLVKQLGGPSIPAVGFGMGIERLLLALSEAGVRAPDETRLDVYVAVHGGKSERKCALELATKSRMYGLVTEVDITDRSIKSQFKYAGKQNARFVLVLGERELSSGTVVVKNMDTGEEVIAQRERAFELVR